MRKLLIYGWLAILMIAITAIFWYTDLVYRLPTPVPAAYIDIPIGSTVNLPASLKTNNNISTRKPVFLHFFNPDCPCSRFNMDHVRKLIKANRDKVNFTLVLVTKKDFTVEEIQHRFGIDIPVMKDDSLAAHYGVYSTPQAVIIDTKDALYYRGNYNKSRYCTDKNTNYAEIALASLLQNNNMTIYDALALKAYGCELPGCKREY